MKPTRLAVFALLILALMSAAGCQRQPPAKEKLVIASPIGLSKLLASVIVDKRFIEQRYGAGIAVEYRVIPSGTVINEGVVAGEIDVAVLPPPTRWSA